MILNWYYFFLFGTIHLRDVYTAEKEKKTLLPDDLVNKIVENEIARKLPSGKPAPEEKKGSKRSRLTGAHMKAATDAINKLVDESIVNRVEEAEKEVSQMLLRNIEHHIQDAGKIFKSPDDKNAVAPTLDRSLCRDKLDSCEKLSQAGVCKTSRDAMRENCRHTCNYCHVMLDHDMQTKLAKELEKHDDGSNKVLSIKWHRGGGVRRKHHRKHHLTTDEIGLLGSDFKLHAQPPPELEKTPDIIQPALSKDEDEQAEELERIKGEANKLLAAQRKLKQQKLAEKERLEAEKLLQTEKKIKEEEQKEMAVKEKHHKRRNKKKKQTLHKPAAKGISSYASFQPETKPSDDNTIPFLNEDPYPLTDFVTEYDKTTAYGRNSVLKARNGQTGENLFNRNADDENDSKLDEDKDATSRATDLDYKLSDTILSRNNDYPPQLHETINILPNMGFKRYSNAQTNAKLDDIDGRYSPQNLILKYDDVKHEPNNVMTKYEDDYRKRVDRSDAMQRQTDRPRHQGVTETDSSRNERKREGSAEQTRITIPAHHTPHNSRTRLRHRYRKHYIDNKLTDPYIKPKVRNDIQNMIDKAFGEVLETD